MIKYLKENLIYLLLILISLLSSIGAVIYYVYKLNNSGIIMSIILSAITFSIITYFHHKQYKNLETKNKYSNTEEPKHAKNKINIFYLLPYTLLLISSFYILFSSQTTQSIISPWQVIPGYFFAVYFLATIFLILNIINNSRFSIFLISTHLFLSTSIAWIIYKIGYGFDPFIHEATMNLILQTGEVLPKPFYYIGQYSLIVIIQKISFLSLIWINKLLVPILVCLLLPYSIYKFLTKWFEDKKIILLTIASLLIIPYSLFIVTTPQNLSYLLLIITIFLGLTCSSLLELAIIYLLAITTLLIHPIAGIPAILFVLLITIYNSEFKKSKKYLYLLTYFLTTISLPISFYFVNGNNASPDNIDPQKSASLLNIFKNLLTIPSRENFIINFVYLYIFNIKLILLILIIAGTYITFKYKNKCKIFLLNIYMAIALLISYAIVKEINFSFLIDYEKDAYAERILILIIIILLPVISIALYNLINKILIQSKFIKYSILIFIAILLTTSLYASYPRFDRYHNSHGYSVSQSDINAVNWIENNHENDYLVLANQQVSVSALREFGFSKYLKSPSPVLGDQPTGQAGGRGEVYFYPIPTGGDLYQYYLKMVYEKPTKKTMTEAMEFAGVNESYFILNKYWWAFPKLLEEAKFEADSWQEIDKGNIFIFKYSK